VFIMTHANSLAGKGSATITHGGGTATIPNAVATVSCELFGVQVICSYTIIGGQVA